MPAGAGRRFLIPPRATSCVESAMSSAARCLGRSTDIACPDLKPCPGKEVGP
jgi:hypothetical protein